MSVYSQVQVPSVAMHAFDNSYDVKTTADMMQCIPVMCDEINPGEVVKISHETVIRFQPLLAPILHEVNVFLNYYFVPYRILWEDWEKFITRVSGEDTPVIPRFGDSPYYPKTIQEDKPTGIGTLWDYFGFQTDVQLTEYNKPVPFPWLSYNLIWNEFIRDENLQSKAYNGPLNDADSGGYINNNVLSRCWKKDYFTSALPFQQRGVAPALPISGFSSAVFDIDYNSTANINILSAQANSQGGVSVQPVRLQNQENFAVVTSENGYTLAGNYGKMIVDNVKLGQVLSSSNEINFSNALGSDINDLRLAIALQHRGELSARGGQRYVEFLQSNYGSFPRDERLQRPEYIGGTVNPVIISEVQQQSDSTQQNTPTGTLYGKATSVGVNKIGNYRAKEFGLIMGILTVAPKPVYQTGIDRQWSRLTPEDYFNPLFNGLSEQAILNKEIYSDGTENDIKIWGYTGMYNELRVKNSKVTGLMRTDFDYWHLSRQFSSLPELNSSFVSGTDVRKDIFAVPSEPGLIINHRNNVKIIRAIPRIPSPGINKI